MINYFISSTFRDMQSERDVLQKIILPEIRKYANIRSQDVFFTDLRWGIDTSYNDIHESMSKIMNICMSEIDNCRPHMIILLGDRYGSLPDNEAFEAFLNNPQGKTFSHEDKEKSITELEIIHGLSHHSDSGSFTICIRDSLPKDEIGNDMIPVYYETDEGNAEKLALLKKRLIEMFPDNIIRYSVKWDSAANSISGMEDFTEKLMQRLRSQIEATLSEPLTPEMAQYNSDVLSVSTKCRTFVGRKAYLDDINDFMKSSDESYLVLTGSSGVGKSFLMAKIADIYRTSYSEVVIFCGNSPYISTNVDLIRNLIYRLCCILKIDYTDYYASESVSVLRETAENLIEQIDGKVLIIIDSLNALRMWKDSDNFLPDVHNPRKCKVIVSNTGALQEHFLLSTNCRIISLDILDEKELPGMIDMQLTAMRKELPSASKQLLLKKAAYKTPLYASMVFHRITNLDESDFKKISNISTNNQNAAKTLYDYIESELNNLPEHEYELAIYLAEFCSYGLAFPFKSVVLQILCAFPDGLRIEDILGIAQNLGEQISILDLKLYLNCMSSMIYTTQNNRIHYLHNIILEAFTNRFSETAKSIYKASLEYFRNIDDADSLKQTDFIRIAYNCKDYRAIAEYISSLYLEEEKLRLKDNKLNIIKTAMFSLRKTFDGMQDERETAEFISAVINSIPENEVDKVYGLCCVFLFSFDAFFGYLGIRGKADDIMKLINDKCIRVLYPHRKENPLYLRAVYVSCEQLGIRTSDYDLRYNAYAQFNQYCMEMYQTTNESYKYRLDIINDLSLSFSKLAGLYKKRDWRRAIALYDKAIEIAQLPCNDKSRAWILEDCMHSARFDKASCIIQKAVQNNMIGWPMDDEMRELLQESKDVLLFAVDYYKADSSGNHANKNADLAHCYMDLADWARATGSAEAEIIYTKEMIKYAKLAYDKNQDLLIFDLIRNGEFRLGYKTEIGEEEEQHLRNAFSMAKEIRQKIGTEISDKNVYYSGGALLLHCAKKLEQLSADDDADTISEICYQALNEFTPVLEIIFFEGDNGKKHFSAMKYVYQTVLKNIEIQKKHAIQALNNHNESVACQKVEFAYKLLVAMEEQSERKNWVVQMLDICYLLSACAHNARCELISKNIDESKADEYYITEKSANAKMYSAILSYEMLFSKDSRIKEYKRVFNEDLLSGMCTTYGWIEFMAENITDPQREEQFWEYINRINYCMPDSRMRYFDILININIKKQLDEHILSIGKYLYSHFKDERVQKLLYFCTLFEDIALEYAYQVMDYDTACRIIENGYDRYLELSTLYIIRRHDRKEFYKRVNELKFICLKKHKRYIYTHNMDIITGRLFASEAEELFSSILSTRNLSDKSDPRRHLERSVFKFTRD